MKYNPKTKTKRPTIRPTEDQLHILKLRAKQNNLSLNDYLIARGLSDGHTPTEQEREERERAVFEIRWAVRELKKITYKLDRNLTVSSSKLDQALDQTIRAATLVGAIFGEEEKN
jgi:hypothetical protein